MLAVMWNYYEGFALHMTQRSEMDVPDTEIMDALPH